MGVAVGIGFAALYLIWGTTYLAIAAAVTDVPPIFMVAARGLFAGGALYLWSRRRGGAPVTVRELWQTLPTAALLFGGGYVLVGFAEKYVPSGPAALLNATTPAWVVLFEWLTRRRSRPSIVFAGALLIGIAGVGVLVGGRSAGALPVLPAIGLVVASIAWAAGTLRTHGSAHGDPFRNASVQLLTGGLLLLPFSVLTGELTQVSAGLSTSSLEALAYLVVAGSIVGYSAYVWLLHHVAAYKVASHAYVNPLIAVGVGSWLGGERVYMNVLLAAAMILTSVFFVISRSSAARA